jgi:transcriptional regulator with XRE-family HTH domain
MPAEMGVKFNANALRRQQNRRGLSGADLATITGLSEATISHARNGRSVSPRTFRAIATALEEAPACPEDLVET